MYPKVTKASKWVTGPGAKRALPGSINTELLPYMLLIRQLGYKNKKGGVNFGRIVKNDEEQSDYPEKGAGKGGKRGGKGTWRMA
ncbi:MAG: hypothetical protein K6F63_03345 [Lachnospiraceae bacterium]|nr:hypothetical protein [Lachnospiraceae bacterium]